jgi:hypothetical protein
MLVLVTVYVIQKPLNQGVFAFSWDAPPLVCSSSCRAADLNNIEEGNDDVIAA